MNTDDMPVVILEGSPRSRGRIHGETLRSNVRESYSRWKDQIHQAYNITPDVFIKNFLNDTHFSGAIGRYFPWFIEEVEGLAEGADVDYATALAAQFMDEEWWFGRDFVNGDTDIESAGCSAFGVAGQTGLPAMIAQNMDVGAWVEGLQTLLHIKESESDTQSLVFTFAGRLALNGMNNHCLAVCCNSLTQLNYSSWGIPVSVVVREILRQRSFEDAVQFLYDVPHASGQNYILGSHNQVGSFECSANRVKKFKPYEGVERVCHTNHPLINDDRRNHDAGLTDSAIEKFMTVSTKKRFESLERYLGDVDQAIQTTDVMAALSARDDPSYPVSRRIDDASNGDSIGYTIGCTVFELIGRPVLHVASGPPCSTSFRCIGFTTV